MFSRHAPGSWAVGARQTMETARDALTQAGDHARQGFHDMSDQARQGLHDMSRGVQRAWDEMEEVAAPYRHSFENAISSHPVKSVAAALAVGVMLGWLIKRS